MMKKTGRRDLLNKMAMRIFLIYIFLIASFSAIYAQEYTHLGKESVIAQYCQKELTDVIKYGKFPQEEVGYIYIDGDSITFPVLTTQAVIFDPKETTKNITYTCRRSNGDQIAVVVPKSFEIPEMEENKKYDMQLFSLKNLMKYNPGPWEWHERNRCIRNYYALEEDTLLCNYMGDVYLCLMSQPKLSLGNDTSLINKKRGVPPISIRSYLALEVLCNDKYGCVLTVNISNNTDERFLVSIGREKDSGDSIKDLLSYYTGMNSYDMKIELDRKEVEGYLNKALHITDGNMILRENDSVEYIFYMMYPQSKEKCERLNFQWRPEYGCEEINLPIKEKEKLTECFMKYIYLCPESEIVKYYFDKGYITLNGSTLIPNYDEQRSYVLILEAIP